MNVKVCTFINTSFCDCKNQELQDVHKCLTDNVGAKLIMLKENSQSEEVKVALSDLLETTDAKARGKYYNRDCLVKAMRTIVDIEQAEAKALYKLSVEQSRHEVVAIVAQKVYNKGSILLSEVNSIFISLLSEKGVKELNQCYTKELKLLIEDKLPNVCFSRPDYHSGWLIILKEEVDAAVREYCCDELTAKVIETGQSIRREILAGARQWAVTNVNSFSQYDQTCYLLKLLLNEVCMVDKDAKMYIEMRR